MGEKGVTTRGVRTVTKYVACRFRSPSARVLKSSPMSARPADANGPSNERPRPDRF